jgi:hypothetical protein
MSFLSKDQCEEIKKSTAEVKAAVNKRHEICKRLFVPGVILYWRSRDYLQTGIVIGFVGSGTYPSIRVRNSKTLKVVDVDLYFVDWEIMELDEEVEEVV